VHAGVTVLAVRPHADDDSLVTSGLLASYRARGVHTGVVTCTGGEDHCFVSYWGRENLRNASHGAERVFQPEALWFLLFSQYKNMPHIAGWAAKTLRQAVIT
jgi:LmbE family N-acetylglucosaminyl deacetylase